MVPVVGLEPTLLAEPDFESGASTSFTTPARSGKEAQSTDASAAVNPLRQKKNAAPSERRFRTDQTGETVCSMVPKIERLFSSSISMRTTSPCLRKPVSGAPFWMVSTMRTSAMQL